MVSLLLKHCALESPTIPVSDRWKESMMGYKIYFGELIVMCCGALRRKVERNNDKEGRAVKEDEKGNAT